jgi:hypothetical protein
MKRYKVSYLLSRVKKWRYDREYNISNAQEFAREWFKRDNLVNTLAVRFIDVETKKVILEIYREEA